MAGALSQSNDDNTDEQDNTRPLSRVHRRLLDKATQSMLDELQHSGPYEAQAAAMLGSNPQGSFPGALGAGIDANLRTRIGLVGLPANIKLREAGAWLAETRARQIELQNQINELNFGYMTEPYNESDFYDSGQGSGTGAAAAAPAAGTGAAAQPPTASAQVAGAPTANGPSGGGSQPGENDMTQGLPLTPESQQRMAALQVQLRRAGRYINKSPQARQDYFAILSEMAKLVQDDPLAKNAIEQQKTQNTADVDLDKQIKLNIQKMGHDSYQQAEQEFTAMASAPNSQINPNDPQAVSAWIDQRAHQIFASQYGSYRTSLIHQGINPDKYLGSASEGPIVADAGGGQGASLSSTAPGPLVARPAGPSSAPAGGLSTSPGGPAIPDLAPEAGPAPSQAPQGTSLTPDGPPAPPPPPARGTAANAFQPRDLTAEQKMAANKEQGTESQSLIGAEQLQRDLQVALELNERSLAGPLVDLGIAAHRVRDTIRGIVGAPRNDIELQNTAKLQSIMSGQTLQNLAGLIKGNPTEGERAYTERLTANQNMTKQERRVLLQRALQLLEPRLDFERMRVHALMQGQTIDPGSYEDWVRRNYGTAASRTILGR